MNTVEQWQAWFDTHFPNGTIVTDATRREVMDGPDAARYSCPRILVGVADEEGATIGIADPLQHRFLVVRIGVPRPCPVEGPSASWQADTSHGRYRFTDRRGTVGASEPIVARERKEAYG